MTIRILLGCRLMDQVLEISDRKRARHSPILDSHRRYLSDSLSPENISSLWKQVDQGDLSAMVELNEEMEAKDAHLQGVSNTRRQSLTALQWSVEPDPLAEDPAFAEETAAYAQTELVGLRSFPNTLEHLATAISPGLAVVELVWRRGRLVETVDVPGSRYVGDPFLGRGVSILTEQSLVEGIPTHHGKWVVFTPNARAGFPLKVTITRAQALLFSLKHYAMADWAGFSEVFGLPWRIAKIEGEPTPAEVTEVRKMLRDMNADTYGVFSSGVEIEFKEAARGTEPFSALVELIEKKQAILLLGQTLTTEVGSTGSFAAAKIHENTRANITLSDIENEARVIRTQIFDPMIRLRWPGQNAPLPIFKRRIIETRDLADKAVTLDQIDKAREWGLPLDSAWLYDALDIPVPEGAPTGLLLPPSGAEPPTDTPPPLPASPR